MRVSSINCVNNNYKSSVKTKQTLRKTSDDTVGTSPSFNGKIFNNKYMKHIAIGGLITGIAVPPIGLGVAVSAYIYDKLVFENEDDKDNKDKKDNTNGKKQG